MAPASLDIVIKAQVDDAQAKIDNLADTIKRKMAQEGVAAFDTMSERIDQAFAQIEVEANQRAAGVQAAFSKLGVTSAASVKAEIQSLITAYRQLKEAGESVSDEELGTAHSAMVSKIQALSAAYRQGATSAKTMGDDGSAAAREVEAAWSRLGTLSTETMAAKAKEIVSAFKTIKENAGDLGSDEIARAKSGMLDSLEKLKKGYQQTGASAKEGMSEAEQASLAAENALSRLGVQSTPQVKARIQSIIADYRTLKQSGMLSARDLNAAHTAMVSKLQAVSAAYRTVGTVVQQNFGPSLRETFVSLQGSLEQLTQGFFNVRNAVAAAIASFAARSLVKTAASFDNFESSLKTVTGSAEGAKAAMAWVTDFATKTPYEIDKVTEAYIRLATRGFDPKEVLQTLGDTASAFNKDLIDVVEAYTDAATGEFERLKEFGVTASVAGNNVTLSWQKNGEALQKTVAKTSSAISQALSEIWAGNNAGGMEDRMSRVAGLWSNLQDVFTQFQNAVMKDGGVWDWLRQKLQTLLSALEELKQNGMLAQYAQDLGAALKTAGEWFWTFGSAVKKAAEIVYAAIKSFVQAFQWIPIPLKEISVAAALVVTALGAMGTAFLVLRPIVTGFKAILSALNFLKAATSVASLTKALGLLSAEFTATKAILAVASGGWLAALAAAFLFAAYVVWKYVSAVKGAKEAQEQADKAWALAKKKAEENDAMYRKLGEAYGVAVTGYSDFMEKVRKGTISLKSNATQAALSEEAYESLAKAITKAGKSGYDYIAQVSDKYDLAAKEAQALAETEGAAAEAGLAAQKQKYDKVLSLAETVAAGQKKLIDDSAANETQKAKLRGEVEKQLVDAKIAATKSWISALEASLDQAVADEKRYAQERLKASQTLEEDVRSLRRETMSKSAAYNDQLVEAAENLQKAQEAAASGTRAGYDLAIQYAQKAYQEFKSSVSAGEEVVGKNQAIETAIKGMTEANKAWSDASTSGFDKAKQDAQDTLTQIENLKQQLKELNQTKIELSVSANTAEVKKDVESLDGMDTNSAHTVTDNSKDILADLNKLDGYNTSSTHTVHKVEVDGYASGGPARSVPAMVMPGEVVIDKDAARENAPLLHAINSMRLAREAVAHFAGGGGVFRPFKRGLVPGVGDEDSEPVTLEEGAFVVRKAAVAKYGRGVLDAIQSGRLAGAQAFATGGFVWPEWMRKIQAATAAAPSAPSAPKPPTPLSVAVSAPAAFRGATTPLAPRPGMSAHGAAAVSRLDGIRHAASINFASGGSLDEQLADIALERKRTQEDYDAAVSDAKGDHDDQLADLLTQEQADLDDIAQTLADTLADLQTAWEEAQAAYQEAVTEAQADSDEAVASATDDYQDAVDDARSEYEEQKQELQDAVDEAYAAWQEKKKEDQIEHGYTKTTIGANTMGGKPTTSYWVSDKDALADWEDEVEELKQTYLDALREQNALGGFQMPTDAVTTLTEAKAEAKTALNESLGEAQAELGDAQNTFTGGTDEAKATAAEDTQTTRGQADSDKADLDADLADTLADLKKDFDRAMEDLDIEEARARADADEEKGYSVSGFSQWLSSGGPVAVLDRMRRYAAGGWAALSEKLPRFADGGEVPMLPGAVAGQDSVLARVMPGEGMVKVQAMRTILSKRALDALNSLDLEGFLGALPRFADGGVVPGGSVAAAAAAVPDGASSGSGYTATLNLSLGGRTFETRATDATAMALARQLRRLGGSMK